MSDSTIIVGDLLLEKSNINIGDYLSIIEINLDSGVENIYNFKISGSFKTNIPDYDSHFIFCNTELLNNVNGYEYFHINNFENLNMEYLENNFFLTDVTDMNKSFFNWLQTYDNPIKILVCFILLISFMNIINNNYYLLYYKKKQINILLTLGIDKFILKYIIITRSVYFSLIGCSLGVLVAYSFLLAEKYFAFVSLPSYIYFIDSLPIEINYNYIIYIFLYIALIGLLSSLFSYRTNSRC